MLVFEKRTLCDFYYHCKNSNRVSIEFFLEMYVFSIVECFNRNNNLTKGKLVDLLIGR